jgi:hypothetical protein
MIDTPPTCPTPPLVYSHFSLPYLMSAPTGKSRLLPRREPSLLLGPGKAFQNRSVSSPAPVTIVCPSGDMARYKTLHTTTCTPRRNDHHVLLLILRKLKRDEAQHMNYS